MHKTTIKNFLILVTVILTVTAGLGGCIFARLEEDLVKLDLVTHLFAGNISTAAGETDGIVIVAMHDDAGEAVTGFRMLSGAGPWEIRSKKEATWIVAFLDLNHDLILQKDEPFAWANGGEALDPALLTTEAIDISLPSAMNDDRPAPPHIIDEPLENKFGNYVKLNIGTITSLNDALFSMDQAEKGLWQPFNFTEDGGAGIHFLEAYDPDRVPVLFVHGISGTPQNFRDLIRDLDTTRYQAWVARGVYQMIKVLHVQHKFDEMHVVAHSMGGLVSKGALNICAENDSCEFLRSYTTISTPWNGVASAKGGIEWSPTVVPVWWDLVPGSDYVTTLFDTPFPEQLSYHLIFGYRHNRKFGSDSSDGVIKLKSQLRDDAQGNAKSIFGYNEGHVSILDNDATSMRIQQILDGEL
jgi:pimeloyl-ACP methyl ester carboxylesterase